jgi:hypothetical protein
MLDLPNDRLWSAHMFIYLFYVFNTLACPHFVTPRVEKFGGAFRNTLGPRLSQVGSGLMCLFYRRGGHWFPRPVSPLVGDRPDGKGHIPLIFWSEDEASNIEVR